MTATAGIYQRMRMSKLKDLARQDADGYDEDATRAYVDRLIDFAAERRYSEWDFRPGWPGMSPTAKAGEAPGGGGTTEQMMVAMEKGWRDSPWHDYALAVCGRLSDSCEMALMIQWLKADSRLDGLTAATYDMIAAAPGQWLQMMGYAPTQPKAPRWANGQAIKKAAHKGRVELLLLAKAGAV